MKSRLLEVALDRIRVADVRVCRIAAGVAQGAPLAEQVPAAVELDLDRAQPLLIDLEPIGVQAVGRLAVAKVVLLSD